MMTLKIIGWGLAVFGVWMLICKFKPYVNCGGCNASGRNSPGKTFGNCWSCKGTGKRLRFGAHVLRLLGW